MFVGISVRELCTVGAAQVAVQTGEGKNVMLAVQGCIFIFLTAKAGVGPKVSTSLVKAESSSWLKLTSCPSTA